MYLLIALNIVVDIRAPIDRTPHLSTWAKLLIQLPQNPIREVDRETNKM